MKVRSGFVSNSSSSSFILALPNDKEESVKIEIDIDLSHHDIVRTKKELNEFFIDHYGYSDNNSLKKIFKEDPSLEDEYKLMLKKIKEGKKLVFGEVSSDGDDVSSFLYNSGFGKIIEPEGVEIIQDCNG